jgi:PIN domain nuclease of toxin-antitoxin system
MKKKFFPVMLSMVFMLSAYMTVSAATATNQDGLSAVLSSEKTAYAANEDVDLNLTVKNTNSYTVEDIKTAITLPEGVTLKSGSLTQDTYTLKAGESNSNALTAIKKVTAVTAAKASSNPNTGDSSQLPMWIALMFISGGAIVAVAVKNRNGKEIISLFLCAAVISTIAIPTSVKAEDKSLTASEEVTVDGKKVTFTASVTYDYAVHSTVTVTGTDPVTYGEGDTVTIAAPTVTGKHFTHWTVVSGGVALANAEAATTTFTMPGKAVEVKPNYAANAYTITASANEGGTITDAGDSAVTPEETKTYTITPEEYYVIEDVKVDGKSKGDITSYSFEDVNADHTIEAVFAKKKYTVTVLFGTIEGGKPTTFMGFDAVTAEISWGETVSVTSLQEIDGDEFDEWYAIKIISGSDPVPDEDLQFKDPSSLTATFTVPKYDVAVTGIRLS